MKNIVLIIAIFASISNFAFSQKSKGNFKLNPKERAEKITAKFSEILVLSEDQKKQVFDIIVDREKNREQIKLNQSTDKNQKLKEAKELKNKFDSKLKVVLSESQYNKLQAYRKEKLNKRKEIKTPVNPNEKLIDTNKDVDFNLDM